MHIDNLCFIKMMQFKLVAGVSEVRLVVLVEGSLLLEFFNNVHNFHRACA